MVLAKTNYDADSGSYSGPLSRFLQAVSA